MYVSQALGEAKILIPRLGSRAGTHREEEMNKSIFTGRKREKPEKLT
jgi:hypothetical protein